MRIILFANGHCPYPHSARAHIRPDDFILCADGGASHALALGLTPDLVIGDMDSLDADTLAALHAAGSEIRVYPQDKNDTDLELALLAARALQPDAVILLGALGGRLDQMLGNVLLLTRPEFATLNITLMAGAEQAWVVRDEIIIHGQPGDTLSALALTPEVTGLTYHFGLRWPLQRATLRLGDSRGISNELVASKARITLESGLLLVIHAAKDQDSSEIKS